MIGCCGCARPCSTPRAVSGSCPPEVSVPAALESSSINRCQASSGSSSRKRTRSWGLIYRPGPAFRLLAANAAGRIGDSRENEQGRLRQDPRASDETETVAAQREARPTPPPLGQHREPAAAPQPHSNESAKPRSEAAQRLTKSLRFKTLDSHDTVPGSNCRSAVYRTRTGFGKSLKF